MTKILTMEDVKALHFHGNHMSDMKTFNRIDTCCRNPVVPEEVKLEALRRMIHEGMGYTDDVVDKTYLEEFLNGN